MPMSHSYLPGVPAVYQPIIENGPSRPDVVSCDYIEPMRTIGIRELKAQLSRTLRDVQHGEHFLVTDRGRVIAELRQPHVDSTTTASPEQAARRELLVSGELRAAEQPRSGYRRTNVTLPAGAGAELLDWVRGSK